MLIFNKLLPVFVLPLGLTAILIVIGTQRKARWLTFSALLGLLIASMPVVGRGLIGRLEARYPAVKITQAGPADAVLVLGGILGPRRPDGYLANWGDGVERFEGGVALLQAGRARRLLFTAATLPWEASRETEGDVLRRRAIERGVEAKAIDLTALVQNTRDEAQQAAAYCAKHGLKRLIVVTSAWHMARALQAFRHARVEVVPFPVDYRSDPNRRTALVDFLPNAEGLRDTEAALRELYGLAFYALIGR